MRSLMSFFRSIWPSRRADDFGALLLADLGLER